jgi:ComF family protein
MLLDFFFPKKCLGCGRWGSYFCQTCLKTVNPFEEFICPGCRRPSILGKTHLACQKKCPLIGLTCLFPYQGPVKKAIKKLKYGLVTDLAEELITKLLNRNLVKNQGLILPKGKRITLIPVPLHPRKQRQRGFNQAALLGKLVTEKIGWDFNSELLIRRRYTKPQVKLKGQKRRQNIKGAFEVNQEVKLKKSVFLIIFDDVWTTGSTLKECASALKKAGFRQLWGLTLAR